MTAAGTLLQTRNQFMVAHATMTGLLLDVGNASQLCQSRLQARSLSVAPKTIKAKQIQLGIDFDSEVLRWKKQVEEDVIKIHELEEQCRPLRQLIYDQQHTFQDRLKLNTFEKELAQAYLDRHPGYKLVGDNIDFSINPRYFTISEGRKSIHYFNFLAIENRVSEDS